MKTETLNTFITARTLFEHAGELCVIDDKHMASAGLVILQDAIELVLYACLKEIGVDEDKDIEKLNFYQMISELVKKRCKLPKLETLKALNKQRVIIKHYGQVAESTTVLNYYESARYSIDVLMQDVVGKNLQDILIHEAIRNDEVKGYIANANIFIEKKEYFDALAEIRKAIFIAIERDYSVFDWREKLKGEIVGPLQMLAMGGTKAPFYKLNKEWIEENVKTPFDYIQLDHERIRIDLLEWGVNTVDFWNLWRLTPKVFFNIEDSNWMINQDIRLFAEAGTEENARYCLDRTVSLLVRQQNHFNLAKYLRSGLDFSFKVRMKDDGPLYSKASTLSEQIDFLIKDQIYSATAVVPGLENNEDFVYIRTRVGETPNIKYVVGYVNYKLCQVIEE